MTNYTALNNDSNYLPDTSGGINIVGGAVIFSHDMLGAGNWLVYLPTGKEGKNFVYESPEVVKIAVLNERKIKNVFLG